jgi:hypothetical protein
LSILFIATTSGTPAAFAWCDGFLGLRHDAVVRRHHQDDDVGRLRTAGAHGREGLVSRRVEERDRCREVSSTWYAPMCWVMPPASPEATLGAADEVEQRGLAVVNVAHHRDHGRTRLVFDTSFRARLRRALRARRFRVVELGRHARCAPFRSTRIMAVSWSSCWLMVTIWPSFIRHLDQLGLAFTDILWARSATLIVSGT